MLLIKNGYVKPMDAPDLPGGCVLIDDAGKIAAVAAALEAPAGAQVIDAGGRLVTPGCVEAHCHVGLDNEGTCWEGHDFNETADPVSPQLRAIDAINPQDEGFAMALRGGVTAVCTGPGSANVVGGTFAAVKTFGKSVDEMVIKNPVAMKCAFGENPKRCYGVNLKKSPLTRMSTAALLRELLFKARAYRDAKQAGKEPPFDMQLEAMLPVINGEIPLKAHAHRADDILTSIRIAKEFGVGLTLDHCTEGYLIADVLAKEGYPAFVGPLFGAKSKAEVRNKSFKTPAALHAAGVPISIISDGPFIPLQYLTLYAGLAVSSGLDREEAWRAITINPAVQTGIGDRVGSLTPGKDGDVVIWTADPLTEVGGEAYLTIVDGKIAYRAG